jgi:hypothetical protein
MTIKRAPKEIQKLASLPAVRLGETIEGFETVKGFLARYGYLSTDIRRSGLLDETTATALVKYQALHSLPLSGVFDEATRDMMSRSRCGFPDIAPASGVAFSTTCAWNTDNLLSGQ